MVLAIWTFWWKSVLVIIQWDTIYYLLMTALVLNEESANIVDKGQGGHASNTYLSSWELAAMRDLRVLSAKGHPETLKRDEKNKKQNTYTDIYKSNSNGILSLWTSGKFTIDWGLGKKNKRLNLALLLEPVWAGEHLNYFS